MLHPGAVIVSKFSSRAASHKLCYRIPTVRLQKHGPVWSTDQLSHDMRKLANQVQLIEKAPGYSFNLVFKQPGRVYEHLQALDLL